MNDHSDVDVLEADSSLVSLLNKSEIDQQIATAHKYPRSLKRFREETLQMVTLNESIAQECIYALPRDGKTIEGPSARFAEVVASAWGNARAGARVVNDSGDFVTAQGVFHDLERNVAITYEVQRRITNKKGQRFSADMISVTANAACSIALRNAILKGVPKAFWADMYAAARSTAIGNSLTLANRRARAIAVLQKYGVLPEKIFQFLGIEGEEDMTLEHLGTLFGITTALKEGETSAEQAFARPMAEGEPQPIKTPQSKSAKTSGGDQVGTSSKPETKPTPPAAEGRPASAKKETKSPAKPTDVTDMEEVLIATEGEKALIRTKLEALNVPVGEACEAVGVTNFDELSPDGYVALRDFINSLERGSD